MLYIIHTTGQCNLRCKYCGGSFPEETVPWKVKYDIDLLKEIAKLDKDMNICFYGGEPLLNARTIRQIVSEVPAKRFAIQTNGLLFKRFNPRFWTNFNTILLSIDGIKEVTDFYRGKGTYDTVLEAAKILKENGYEGDVVARMALARKGDVFRDVKHLLSLDLFDHVHWQLNVIWCNKWNDFEKWVEQSYVPGFKKLVDLWIKEMENGKVLGVAPLQGILKRMIYGGEVPPCGAGKDMVAISTDGRILACPIAFEERWAELSDITKFERNDLEGSLIREPCIECEVFKECGGRCLYTYMERLWGEDGFIKICELNKRLIFIIREKKDRILDFVNTGKIKKEKLFYPMYNNTIEIIP